MNLHACILTENDCYKRNRHIKPKGVMVHSTGANNPWLKRYVQPDDGLLGTNKNGNSWNRGGVEKCVHAFIGKLADGTIASYQTLPWDMRGWHAGGNANNTHIGFEICEDDLKHEDYFRKVYREAVELTAYLCGLYGLDPLADGVVICHSEGHERGIASGHADVMHWFPKHGASMDGFRRDVAEELKQERSRRDTAEEPKKEDEDMVYYQKVEEVPVWYRPSIQKLITAGILKGVDDKGKLDISDDYCRVMATLDRLGLLDR